MQMFCWSLPMPIRPERKHLYPANWKTEIVPMIRARSGDCCEWCGVMNSYWICRSKHSADYIYSNSNCEIPTKGFCGGKKLVTVWASNEKLKPSYQCIAEAFEWKKPIRVILTVAHLIHDETDNRPENLAHFCQLHHNRHDAKHRAETRARNKQ